MVLSGCSTGPYLKPYASLGWYNTENPACPGEEEVLEFSLPDYDWVIFRVLAKQQTKYQPEGTKLIAYILPRIYKHPEPNGSWSLFPSEEERKNKDKIISKRKAEHIEVLFSGSSATVVLPDGTEKIVELPFFQEPYKLPSGKYYGIWGPEAIIPKEKLDAFDVILPTLYINGKEFKIPTINFKISENTYAPVLNC